MMGWEIPWPLDLLAEASVRTALLAALVAAGLRLFRIKSPAVRHAAWSMVLAAILVSPFALSVMPPLDAPAVAVLLDPSPRAASEGMGVAVTAGGASTLVAAAYWIVAAALGLQFLVGIGLLQRLGGRARTIPETDLPIAARQLFVSRRAKVLESDAAAVPLAFGLLRPVILLPSDWRSWPTSQLCAVLNHEMAHHIRRDALPMAAAAIACSVFWFNPLVWILKRKLNALAEEACDDLALRGGAPTSDYARALLQKAERVTAQRRRVSSFAAAMARSPRVSLRVERILSDGPRPLGALSKNGWLRLAGVMAPLAALSISLSTALAQDAGGTLRGAVRNQAGDGVANARVLAMSAAGLRAEDTTDESGSFEIGWLVEGEYQLFVVADGFATFEHDAVEVAADRPVRIEVRLTPAWGVATSGDEPPEPPKRIRIDGAMQVKRRTFVVRPPYPPGARADRVQGKVVLDALINKEGRPVSLTVTSADADARLIEAAVEAVKQWRYKPTLLNGRPVEVLTTIEVNFTLSE